MFRSQLQAMKNRLAMASSLPSYSVSSPSLRGNDGLGDLRAQFQQKRREHVDRMVHLLKEVDPFMDEKRTQELVRKYLD